MKIYTELCSLNLNMYLTVVCHEGRPLSNFYLL